MARAVNGAGNPSSVNFSLDEYLFFLLAQAMSQYEFGIEEVLKPVGFSKTRWRILMSLKEKEGLSISDISAMTSTRRSTTSRVVDQLEKDGLVVRRANDADNRVTEVVLSRQGKQSLDRILGVIGKQYQRSIAGLPASDIRVMKRSLRLIVENLQRSPIDNDEIHRQRKRR